MTPAAILQQAIENGVFPGAVALCARADDIQFHGAAGQLGVAEFAELPATLGTLYDLASLSKLYVLAAALKCLRANEVALDAPLAAFVPGFAPQLTLAHLMNHSSGLELHLQSLAERDAGDWLPALTAAPLTAAPGARVLYLCTNYFLLGRALVAIEGAPLHRIVEKYLLRPANLRATFAPADLTNVAPTEANGQGGFWRGEVHDEAARSFGAQTGDCAGNAGLFADAADVAKFARLWLDDFFDAADLAALDAAPLPEANYWRGLGFQLDAPFYMSQNAPTGSWGHLGFTGPSLVLHRASRSAIVVLNNRVHPTRERPNRMPYHRAIAAWSFARGDA